MGKGSFLSNDISLRNILNITMNRDTTHAIIEKNKKTERVVVASDMLSKPLSPRTTAAAIQAANKNNF